MKKGRNEAAGDVMRHLPEGCAASGLHELLQGFVVTFQHQRQVLTARHLHREQKGRELVMLSSNVTEPGEKERK